FDQFAAGKNSVLASLIDLNDFKIVSISDVLREVLRSGDINLGGGQKSFDPDVHEQATFDYALDFPGYGPALVADGEDAFPIFLELGLFLGEDDHALLVFEFFNQDIDFVADFNGFDVFKFVGGDDALAL